tara:strand:- start:2187 stop:2360 length:174 start_codon:yes stop_codon:yes gene_type:complete
MEDNYSIEEILLAVDELQNLKKDKSSKYKSIEYAKSDNLNIPKNTLKLIEEAEKNKN